MTALENRRVTVSRRLGVTTNDSAHKGDPLSYHLSRQSNTHTPSPLSLSLSLSLSSLLLFILLPQLTRSAKLNTWYETHVFYLDQNQNLLPAEEIVLKPRSLFRR